VQDAGKSLNVAILCSVGVNPGYVLVNNNDYPDIADDYVRSFKALRSLPVDVFLGAHGSFYGLPEKYARLDKGGANPFIDPEGFEAHRDRQEKNFMARLDEQKKAPAK
jgi:metallo-beta-lactamase class B